MNPIAIIFGILLGLVALAVGLAVLVSFVLAGFGLVRDGQIAGRNLLQHRRRTLLLGAAIAGVALLFIGLWGTLTSMRETMLTSATTLMSGDVNIGGFYKVTAGQSAPVVTHYAEVEKVAKQALGDKLNYMVARGRGWAKLVSDTGSMQVGISGIDIAKEPGFKKIVQVIQGNIEDLAKPDTILIFEDQAKKLNVKVGDALTFSAPTSRGVNNTVDVRVAAIAQNVGLLSAWNTYIPSVTLRKLYDLREDATGAVFVYLKDVNQAKSVAATLRDALDKAGYKMMEPDPRAFFMKFQSVNREDWTGQKLDVTTWDEEVSFLSWILTGFGVISGILAVVLIAIIVVGIMNTMWIAVRERTREIGTLRAIGMQRTRVLTMFLAEALMLGLFAAGTGAVLAVLGAIGINAAHLKLPPFARVFLFSEHFHLALHPGSVVGIVLALAALATVASLYPAYRAARLKPVTAMYHVG